MTPWKALYHEAIKNDIKKYVELFNINYNDFILSVTGQESLHFPEDCQEMPLVAAEKSVSSRFPTASSVLDVARHVVAHEISTISALRAFLRRIFSADAVVSVSATDKGIKEIQPGHPYYSFKYLLSKPVSSFNDGQFLQIVRAESDGLVNIDIKVEEEVQLLNDLNKYICNDYA